MERSCLGDSRLVKCDGETMRQIQRDEINGGGGGGGEEREDGGKSVNNNKQNMRVEADRRRGDKYTDTLKTRRHTNGIFM